MFKDEKTKIGDILKGNFKLYLNGIHQVEYDKEATIELGKNEYLDDLDTFLINRKYKRNYEIDFNYRKDHPNEFLAGKSVKLVISHIEINPKSDETKKETVSEIEKLNQLVTSLKQEVARKELEILNLQTEFKFKAHELSKKAEEKLLEAEQIQKEKLNKERQEIKDYALQRFFEDFLLPFNNLTMAVKVGENSQSAEVKNYNIGFNIVIKQFEQVFENHGVELIIPQLETEFNPECQQVVDFMEDLSSTNLIKKVTRYGLKLNNRVVTPASVVLSKKN
ncbi:molecular chaperone GrpE [Mycoplasmopsis mustelae]|uniref:Protein GrpE n=1 Tax=Mycoplasmopsis mustelae TaxID=171289 RepID=A0A4V3FNZ8_9BACT|nr:nucleotide exchange factor GrpE [Mycoplasmopsis mustelae]TDV24470.1 molecular chaperone GrpE [Mycoplasmopsis mustelae]